MYIFFFGGFIVFLDWINFTMDLNKNKKNKKEKLHKNLLLRYFNACNDKKWFIRISHYLCIIGIIFSFIAQLISLIPILMNDFLLGFITVFLICLLFYLAAYQLARALFIHYKQSNNIILYLAFLFVIAIAIVIEVYIIIQSFIFL